MIISLESCKDLNDKELVKLALQNLDYFSCLYQRYEPVLSRYILHLSSVDPEEAQDILQESFIKIWRNLNEFDSTLKFSSWAYRIVHNETISYIRKKRSFGKDRTEGLETLMEIPEDIFDPPGQKEERTEITGELLGRLPMKYREVLILQFFEKKSYDEISDILKIPEGTVAVRINRAKKILRELIKERTQ